jgi:hypothetical protein
MGKKLGKYEEETGKLGKNKHLIFSKKKVILLNPFQSPLIKTLALCWSI